MKFIDLFAGLGGFHLALRQSGHECVFASEIDPTLQKLYKANFGLEPEGDITEVELESIPHHDIICAGFPCQPFSKAGGQNGLSDPRGALFSRILEIARYHKPRYLLLENVPNFARHDGKQTWLALKAELQQEGYEIDEAYFSPHQFGIPQVRNRIFIVGDRCGLSEFEWPVPSHKGNTTICSVLDIAPPDARKLSADLQAAIKAWQQFLNLFPADYQLPSFPIWSMEFGATYPFEWTTPHSCERLTLIGKKGAFGSPLSYELDKSEMLASLPSYARTPQEQFPEWKRAFIRQNRQLYQENQEWIDDWLPSIRSFPASFQKLEWNAKGSPRDLSKLVLQTRASGIRAKRPISAPSLVAMTSTQVPIIPWEKRYMTPTECARLQSMEGIELPQAPTRAYEALGNAVNVTIVEEVARALLTNRHPRTLATDRLTSRQMSWLHDPTKDDGQHGDSIATPTARVS